MARLCIAGLQILVLTCFKTHCNL